MGLSGTEFSVQQTLCIRDLHTLQPLRTVPAIYAIERFQTARNGDKSSTGFCVHY